MKFRAPSLQIQIFIGLLAGIVFGLIAIHFQISEFTLIWIKPFGTLFLRLLKLLAVPLIFISLIYGISNITNLTQLSKIGVRVIALYIITTVIAITVGLFWVNIIKPGRFFPAEQRELLIEAYQNKILNEKNLPEKPTSPLESIVSIVPENIFEAAANNRNMLQVIFFAVLFGVALVAVGQSRSKPLIEMVDVVNQVFIKMVQIIMHYAPIGVFCIMSSILVETTGTSLSSSMNLLATLGVYAVTILLGLFSLMLVIYPLLIHFFSRKKIGEFLKSVFPAQMVAFTTSSSVATLPVTMHQCEKKLGINSSLVSFVVPVGATINMDGTSLYQAVAAVFIANIFGMDLTFSDQLLIILTATLASIGSAGVPSAGVIMLLIVLESIHVPAAGIALILAVDRPLDMFRTTLNVTGDCVVCSIIDRWLNYEKS
ncbi:MAG TPA: dicarboxylate/amino acid:cation symporter [Salinivirgaceae bacterium]|nr:dicarboxylate/amino acid:cation symporter [Salinivirgaceae bacterium]